MRLTIDSTTGCWLWTGKPTKQGYGQLSKNGKNYKAHRYVYEQVNGAIPAGYDVHHDKCKKLCVNPGHMLCCTKQEHQQLHANDKKRDQCKGCGLDLFICAAMQAVGTTGCRSI